MVSDIATPVSLFFTAQKVAHTNMPYTPGHKQQAIIAAINDTHPGSADSINSVPSTHTVISRSCNHACDCV